LRVTTGKFWLLARLICPAAKTTVTLQNRPDRHPPQN